MARHQNENQAGSGRKRPKPNAGLEAEGASSANATGSSTSAESPTSQLHLHIGNAVVHAALAGGGEKGPLNSMVMSSVLLDAAGMPQMSDQGSNSSVLRKLASQKAEKASKPGGKKGGGGKKASPRKASGGGRGTRSAEKKAFDALASELKSSLFGGEQKGGQAGGGTAKQGSAGKQGGGEGEEKKDPILSMLPMAEKLFAEEAELAKTLGTQGLLAQLEQAAGGEMPIAVALQLMRTLGEATQEGGEGGADLLKKALGQKGEQLAELFLPQSEESSSSEGAGGTHSDLLQSGGGGGSAAEQEGSEEESGDSQTDILSLLPKVEKLLADEANLAGAMGSGGLLEQLEQAAKGELPDAAVREVMQVFAGGGQGAQQFQQAMGDKGSELVGKLGLGKGGDDAESAVASEDYAGTTSEGEASDDGSEIRAMLPMVEQLFAEQAELTKALESSGLMDQLKKVAGDEMGMTDALQLLQQLGKAAEAGEEDAMAMLQEAFGDQAQDLADRFLPDLGGSGRADAGPQAGQGIMNAPLQVARSVFKDRLTPTANDGAASLQEIAGVKGADFGASQPLRKVLSSGHGSFAEGGFQKVIDAMSSAMESADWEGYDAGRIVGAGSGALTERIDAAPENNKVATALEIARKGNRTSVPYQRRLQQDLRHLLDDGDGGFDYGKLSSIQVYISDVACRSLNAEAFTYGNMIVLRSDAPAYEIVKEEVIHVIQQGGVNIMALPSAASMTKPTDAVEVEAAGLAGGQRHSDHVTTSGLTVARAVSIGESQGEVYNAVVENVIPNGYSSTIEQFTSEADQIQGGLDSVKDVINTADSFPLDKVDALFSSNAFDIFDPNEFMTSLKPSGDTIVSEVVDVVMNICDNALGILDGMIGVVTEIMNVVESFVQLLDSMANAMDVLGAILIGIGTGLIFVVIPSGIGSQFVQWGNDLRNIGSKIGNISEQVKSFLEPLQEVIEKIEKVKEQIEKIREITQTIQECLDVYEWFNSDTSEARRNQSDDMMGSVERTGELLGQLTGGKYQDFATKFWENSLPVISYMLEGQPEVRDVNNQMNPGPLGIAVPGAGPSAPGAAQDPAGVNEAFAQKKGERGGEGQGVFKDIVDPISWPSWFKPKPSDGISVVLGFITKGTAGDAGMPGADTHTHPGQTQGGGAGSGESIVSGAIGVVGNMTNVPLNVESLVTAAVEVTSHTLDQDGYPSNIAETFDYLNNIVQMGEPADSLEVQGSQRMQEARILQENAQNSITASQNIIDISIDQQEKSKRNEDAGHEGVGFMQYLQSLSQELQANLQQKMQEMMQAQALTDDASNQAVQSAQDAAKGAESGGDLGVSGGSIASMIATAIIQVIIQQLIPQLGIGEMLKNLIPEDLGKIIDLATTFIDTAQGSHDRAVEKENEANYSEGVLNQAIATDQRAQAQAAQQQSEAEQMRATAEETLAAAEQAETDGQTLREESAAFDQALKDEQAWIESNLSTHLSEAGPMRPRTETEFVDAPTNWEGVEVDNPASKAAGGTVVNEGPLPVSSDMGYPDPVAGPVPTELIQAVPLPPVISEIFSTVLDAYRMFTDLDLQWSGNVKEPTMEAPAGTALAGSQGSQSTREQPEPIMVGGGGGGGYDEGWEAPAPPTPSADDLVTQRELDPDQLETFQGVEKRAEDPQIPFTPEAQRAQLSQPASDALIEQEAQRHQQIETAQGQIPHADYMYNTLAPLPSILPPQAEFVDLEPMDTSGLGYNTQKIMIDPDIAQVRSWISTLPTEVKLLGPGTTGGLTMPTIMKPDVPTATGLPVLELPELVLNPVPGIQTPALPATDVRRDHPEKYGAAQDVRGADGLLDLKHEATLQVVGQHADQHEAREGEILGQAQQRTAQVQSQHQSTMDQTLTRRDELMKEIRDWMEQSQNDTIRDLEQQSQDRENARFDAMQSSLDTGLSDANTVMREGEATAFSLEAQATADATQVNAEAMAKVATMWGWFQEEVSTFTANIATMLSQLWNSANTAVDLTLTGAQVSAMSTLTMASDRATMELAELGLEVPRIYDEARSKLGDIGSEARQRLRSAIDETVQGMIEAATTAATAVEEVVSTTSDAIDQLAGETEQKVEAEWEDFDAFAEKLRQADVIGPEETVVENQPRDPSEPIPTHPSESRTLADTARDQGGPSQPGADPSAPNWQMPPAHTPAPVPQGQSASEVTNQFVASTPTAKAETWGDVGQSVTQAVQIDESAFQSSIDPLHAQMAGEASFSGSSTSVRTPGGGYQPTNNGALPTADMAPTPQQSTGPVADNPTIGAWEEPSPETDARPNASQVADQINLVPVSDPSIITNPGPAPAIPLTGAADPARMGQAANEALTEATQRTTEAMQQVAESPGPELVVPLQVEEAFPVDGLMQAETQEATEAVAKMDEYLEHGLTGDVTGQFDAMYGPEMESNLADFKAQVLDAESHRDLDRETEIANAQQEARAESERAQAEQMSIVDEKRRDITQKRDETVQAQQDALDQLSAEARAEYDAKMAEAQARVNTTQRQINQEFINAQRRAEEEVRQGERRALEEKRRAERESENQSWWRRAASWVRNALQALTDTINSIFDAVRSAVTSIIDGVKALATTLIDAATSFIQGVIQAYGAFLSFAIDNLIGSVFPELAQELTDFVDSAVEWAQGAIEHLATNLKTYVSSLLDTLTTILDGVLKLFQTAVNVQLGLAYAILTGDWEDGLKMALDAVLALAGIDTGEFYGLLGTADDTIMHVLRNPGEFVSNAINAAGQGFQQFGGNFLTHVINGFTEWAFGASISVGLLMEQEWSARSVFGAAADLMGLSEPKLMEKAIEVVGQENVARFSWVWDFVDNAIQGGVIGLWDHVQENLGGMYEGVVDTIQNWLMVNIAQEAAIKLLSMFSPIGAIVQAVMTAWDVYVFLRDNIQEIYAVIQAFVTNFSELAMGNLTAAANGIEQGLASLIPITLDLLAQVFGLSGAQEKVYETVDGVRDVVDAGVTTFLEGLSATFPQQRYTGMHDSEKNIPTHQFEDELARPHEMWMEEDGSVWMKSIPEQWQTAISHEDRDWNYLSDGDKGSVTQWATTAESGVDAGITGDTAAVDAAVQALSDAASQLPGAEIPASPIVDTIEGEADTQKDDGTSALGEETSESVVGDEDANASAVANGEGNSGAVSGVDAGNAVPDHLDDWQTAEPSTGWYEELELRELFSAGAEMAGQAINWEGINQVDPELGGMSRLDLVLDALGTGAAKGAYEGVKGILLDTAINVASTKIPYLAGIVEVLSFAWDPKGWIEGVGNGLMGGGNFGQAMSSFSEANVTSFEGWVNLITGVLQFVDGINSIISTVSKVCWFVAGVGAIAAIFFPALWPFVAMAAQWGMVIGGISTAIGLAVSALRALVILLQSLMILYGDADPEELLASRDLLAQQTETFTQQFVERAGDQARDHIQGRINTPADAGQQRAPQDNLPASGRQGDPQPAGGFSRGLHFLTTGQFKNDGVGTGIRQVRSELANGREAYRVQRETFTWSDLLLRGNTGQQIANLESEGIAVYPNAALRNRANEQLAAGKRDPRFVQAQQDLQRAQLDYNESSSRAATDMERVQQSRERLEQARQSQAGQQLEYQGQIANARNNLAETENFAASFETASQSMMDKYRSANDAARQSEYLSRMDPADLNLRLEAQAARRHADRLGDQATQAQADAATARQMVTDARTELTRIESAISALQLDQGRTERARADNDAYAAVVQSRVAHLVQVGYPENAQYWEITPPGVHWDLTGGGGGVAMYGQNRGAGKTGSLTGFLMEELVDRFDPIQQGLNEAAAPEHEPERWETWDWVPGEWAPTLVSRIAADVPDWFDFGNEPNARTNQWAEEQDALGDMQLDVNRTDAGSLDSTSINTAPMNPDYQRLFEQSYNDTVGQLPEPDLTVPGLVDGAASALDVIIADENATLERLAVVEEHIAIAENNQVELDGVDSMLTAGEEGVGAFHEVADFKLERQAVMREEATKTTREAADGSQESNNAATQIMNIAGGFMDMLNVIPGRWQGRVSGAFEAIGTLQEAGTRLPEATNGVTEGAAQAQSDAQRFRTDTTAARADGDRALGSIGSTQQTSSETRSVNDQQLGELTSTRTDTTSYLNELQLEKMRLGNEHASGVNDASNWAGEHRSMREAGIAALESIASEVQAHGQ